MLTYDEALDYLYSFVDYGQTRAAKYSAETFDLGRMVSFLGWLGNPHTRFPVVHVAGTKGKGSVSAMCASALHAAGYRTGFYCSPHLLDFCERAQIDGDYIPRLVVAEIVSDLQSRFERAPGITTFELTTALAFQYFAREKVDVAVVEVGLGGRLDATNVVTPLVSVITSLSYDHTHLLGDTLAQIAAEKGGIIKPGVPVVTAPQRPEALEVLERLAVERGAPLTVVGRDWMYRPLTHSLDGQTFEVWSAHAQQQLHPLGAFGHAAELRPARLELPLLGGHQVENGAVAYAALTAVRQHGLPISPHAIREGMRTVRWPGRFEILSRQPCVVLDGAHNRDSAQKLVAALNDYFPGRRRIVVFGASSDKDARGMLDDLLAPEVGVAGLVLTQAVHPRAQDPEELAELAREQGVGIQVISPVAHALECAVQQATPDDVIVACGSLFVVAEARAAWLERMNVSVRA